ncbi:MAG: DinB family protein [Thermoplasmata archaeon]|nr:DinB family protein [Thermoplasmata archaeon]
MARQLQFPAGDAISFAEYNRAVFERFARRVRRLPRKEAFRRRGIGHESLFDTLVHILNVQEVWLVYIVRGRNSDRELEALFEDSSRHPKEWKGFDAYSRRVWEGVEETLRPLGSRELGRKVKAFWMPGNYTVRDALLQVSLEEAHHLGEIIGALWQKDVEPPPMTWIDTRRALSQHVARRPK